MEDGEIVYGEINIFKIYKKIDCVFLELSDVELMNEVIEVLE